MDAQEGALRFYAWVIWFSSLAWIVSKLAVYSAAHGGVTESWLFVILFGVVALAPKGIQGLILASNYRKDMKAAELRLAGYSLGWVILLAIGLYGFLKYLP